MSGEPIIKLSLKQLAGETLGFWRAHQRLMAAMTLAVWLFLSAGFCFIGGWSSSWFLLWMALFYYFWYVFIRFVFDRQPCFSPQKLLSTLIPFTRILFVAFVVATLFVLIPFAPYIMDVPVEVKENYSYFQQRYMQDSDAYDLVLNGGLILALPPLFIRPFMAWISAVIGRSWSMQTAWEKTRGHYFEMCILVLVADILFWLLRYAAVELALPCVIVWLAAAPLIVFGALVLVRMYAAFYAVS